MAEICFFFFNKKIKNLYFIDDSLKINIKNDNESVKKRFEYYNSNKKRSANKLRELSNYKSNQTVNSNLYNTNTIIKKEQK